MKPRLTPRVTTQGTADSASYLTILTGKWVLVYGAGTSGVRISDEIRAMVGSWAEKAQWRTAAVTPEIPDAWTLAATPRTNNGVTVEDFTPTTGKLWIQPGIAAAATSGVAEALVSLQMAVKSNAEIVATGDIQLEPDLNTSATAYYPIGSPVPAVGLAGLMFGFVVTGVNGTLTYQGAWRGMDRLDEPGAWNDLGSPQTTTTNERFNSGDCAFTSSNMFVQAGVKVTTAARGTLQTLVAARF